MTWRRWAWIGFLGELVACVFLPLVFISIYIFLFAAHWTVIGAHFFVIFSFWLGLFVVRLVLWRTFGWWGGVLAVVCWLLPVLFLLGWYLLVLLGLFSWGRVVTVPLITAYAVQALALLEVLGISIWVVAPGSLLVAVGIILLGRVMFFADWSRWASDRLSLSGLCLMAALSGALVFGQYMRLCDLTELHPQEPIGVSFFGKHSASMQSHSITISPVLDASEDRAYSNYAATEKIASRNVILIVGDALRADHMSVYGYSRPTTPFLDASRERHQTLVVSPARSVCAESSCGLAAIASSRPLHLFPSKPFTLHEVLRRHNYAINMVLSGDHTNFYGLRESYGVVDSYFDGTLQKIRYVNDDQLVLDHVAGLPDYDRSRPVMFQFHLMSSHGLGRRHAELFAPSVNYYKWVPGREGIVAPSEDEKSGGINYYDNGVVQFDYVVNGILSALEGKGYLDDAVIVITGDHGERLGENEGSFGHQYNVEEGVLTVPLIIQRRGYVGAGIKEWPIASQVDVAPTILSELGVFSPSVWTGQALQNSVVERKIYFQQARKVGFYTSISPHGLLKYWRDLDSGEEFIYTVRDGKRGERINIEALDAELLGRWRASQYDGYP